MKILLFDTESTGLADFNARARDPKQPHIVQLAAELFDENGNTIEFFETLVKGKRGDLDKFRKRLTMLMCNENQILFPPVKPSNRLTSPLPASLHTRAGTFQTGATMKRSELAGNRFGRLTVVSLDGIKDQQTIPLLR